MTGAAKTVVRSIEDLAENTKKLMEGEVVVELDPRLLDVSFVADRLSDEGEEYQELKQAIKESGQTTPILVRPSSSDSHRFMRSEKNTYELQSLMRISYAIFCLQ